MTATTATPSRLYRSTRDRKIAGVCGGIAEAMGWDPTAVRLAAALSILLPGPQFIVYLIAWIIMPTDTEVFGPQAMYYSAPTPPPPAPPAPGAPEAPAAPEAPQGDAGDEQS